MYRDVKSHGFRLQETAPFFGEYINIVPFLVVLPFAMSYMDDSRNKILPVLQVRSGVKLYYISKGLACFVGGFTAFFVPIAVNMLLNTLTFPHSGITFIGDLFDFNYVAGITGTNVVISTKWAGMWFPRLFLANPETHHLLFGCIFSVAMGIFSLFVYAVSFLIGRRKILLFLPLFILISCLNMLDEFALQRSTYQCYKVLPYLTVNSGHGKNPAYILLVFSLILFLTWILIHRQIRKDQLNPGA